MAKTDNLVDFLVDLADGIRVKKGITGDINPQDFRAEIESIKGGGGIPDVPTLECWKIVVTDDNRDATMEFIDQYLQWGTQGTIMSTTHLVHSEYDIDVIQPGAEIYGGSGPWPEALYEIYILLYKKCFDGDMRYDYFLEHINAAQGEKISLNEWLAITAQAKNNYEVFG